MSEWASEWVSEWIAECMSEGRSEWGNNLIKKIKNTRAVWDTTWKKRKNIEWITSLFFRYTPEEKKLDPFRAFHKCHKSNQKIQFRVNQYEFREYILNVQFSIYICLSNKYKQHKYKKYWKLKNPETYITWYRRSNKAIVWPFN